MDLTAHYDHLYRDAVIKIATGHYQVDPLIDSATDNRHGITLLIRPGAQVKRRIQTFLCELKALEPQQYYYRDSDIHITVMSLITCYPGFDLNQISVADYVALIRESLQGLQAFEIAFRGITASAAGVMIQGFFQDQTLITIRDNLRTNFRNSSLQQTIDKRYSIQTAHSTVVRFREKLENPDNFLALLDRYRHFDFGTFPVDSLELVFNDWYQRKEQVKTLHRFSLP